MTCPNCGHDLPSSTAKFCPDCGTRIEQALASDDATTVLVPAGPAAAAEPDPEPEADPDPTPEAEPDPTPEPGRDLEPEDDPAPASRVSEERSALSSFVDAIVPLLTTPIVVFTALAALLATVISFVVSTAVYAVIRLIADDELPTEAGDWWEFAWTSHFQVHQVPFVSDETDYAVAPILLVPIAIGACLLAVRIARTLLTRARTADAAAPAPAAPAPAAPAPAAPAPAPAGAGTWVGALAFAAVYLLVNLVLSAFGPDDVGIAVVRGILLLLAIALIGYWLTARRHVAGAAPIAAAATRSTSPEAVRVSIAQTVTVFAGMVAIASVFTLVANLVQVLGDDRDDDRAEVTNAVLYAVDRGWATTGHGMFAAAQAEATRTSSLFGDEDPDADRGDTDSDAGNEDSERVSLRIWDLRDDDLREVDESDFGLAVGGYDTLPFILVVVAGFGVVLLGGLFSGFRLVQGADTARSNRSALLTGALVGPIWVGIALVLSWFVTDRYALDAGFFEVQMTSLAGVEVVLLALVLGAVLGALGGLLAARSHAEHAPGFTDSAPPPGIT